MEGKERSAEKSVTSEQLNQALEKELIPDFYEEQFGLTQKVFEHILSPNFDQRVSLSG